MKLNKVDYLIFPPFLKDKPKRKKSKVDRLGTQRK